MRQEDVEGDGVADEVEDVGEEELEDAACREGVNSIEISDFSFWSVYIRAYVFSSHYGHGGRSYISKILLRNF